MRQFAETDKLLQQTAAVGISSLPQGHYPTFNKRSSSVVVLPSPVSGDTGLDQHGTESKHPVPDGELCRASAHRVVERVVQLCVRSLLSDAAHRGSRA